MHSVTLDGNTHGLIDGEMYCIPRSPNPPFLVDSITGFEIMLSKLEYDGRANPKLPQDGKSSLVLSSMEAYPEVTTPRYIYVSSAGVTRPGRPGIDIDSEPPAVRMNDMLGGILTYKLKAEDAIRVRAHT